MRDILKRYRTHSFVNEAVHNQKTGYFTPKGTDVHIVNDFLGEAGTYALLSVEDEQELFGYIDAGLRLYEELGGLENLTPEQEEVFIKLAAAQQVIYHTNLRLAIRNAKPFMGWQGNHLEAMDHIQEALVGLSTAINRFDVSRGYKFSTYGTQWIQQNIRRSIAGRSRTIRIPVHKHEEYLKVKKKVTDYAKHIGRHLTKEEIETASGLDYDKYGELMRVGASYIPSLDQALPHSDDWELGEVVGYDHMNRAIEAFSDREELAAILENANLSDKDMFILGLRFAISPEVIGNPVVEMKGKTVSYEDVFMKVSINPESNTAKAELTLEELADMLGLTRERIRQIQNKAVERLAASAEAINRRYKTA